jgi:hypothetical protein
MAMDVEYVHNLNVFEVLTALGDRMELEKRPIAGAASDYVWQNPPASSHHLRLS